MHLDCMQLDLCSSSYFNTVRRAETMLKLSLHKSSVQLKLFPIEMQILISARNSNCMIKWRNKKSPQHCKLLHNNNDWKLVCTLTEWILVCIKISSNYCCMKVRPVSKFSIALFCWASRGFRNPGGEFRIKFMASAIEQWQTFSRLHLKSLLKEETLQPSLPHPLITSCQSFHFGHQSCYGKIIVTSSRLLFPHHYHNSSREDNNN